jgi:RNA-directed DNA polymerase
VRYADDFIILVGVPHGPGYTDRAREAAVGEKAALASVLKETLNLELSEQKTLVTPVTQPLRFLGHHVRVQHHPQYGWCSKAVIPKDRSRRFRVLVRRYLDVGTCNTTLRERLELLNPFLRGWSNFYCHAWGAKRVFVALDSYVWRAIRRWLRRKHGRIAMDKLYARYGWRKPGGRTWRWRDGDTRPFELASQRVGRFRPAWMRTPDFAQHEGEPGA